MKLRLVLHSKKMYLYCSNGSIHNATSKDIKKLLMNFKNPNIFRGSDGFWDNGVASIDTAPGITLAYVDDANRLIVADESIFDGLLKEEKEYISATEYALLHKKSRASIKNICRDNKIPGAYKTSSGWLIPKDAPYPKDGRASNGGHSTSKKSK